MPGVLHELLSRDHERLDLLLRSMIRADGSVDSEADAEFRRGLLRHIGIEERILFSLLRKHSAEAGLIERLHRDHAALSALLVPPPTTAEVDAITAILQRHNPLEEGPRGLYARVEELAGEELEEVVSKIAVFPQIPVSAHVDTPVVRRSIAQLVGDAERKDEG